MNSVNPNPVFPLFRPTIVWFFVLLAAAGLAAWTASEGLGRDQRIFYQAALRAAEGQLPYRDYSVAQGPLTGVLGGLFLKLAPTGGWGWLVASAALNLLATAAAGSIVWRATSAMVPALIAAWLTAVWFLPVVGSYFADHLAYALILAAYACFQGGRTRARLLVAGALAALAYHAKQPVGAFGAVAFLASRVLVERRRAFDDKLLLVATGYVAMLAVTWGLIAATGGWRRYWLYTLIYPTSYVAASDDKSLWRLIEFLVVPWRLSAYLSPGAVAPWLFVPLAAAIYAAYFRLFRDRHRFTADTARASALVFLVLSTLWGGALAGRYYAHLFFGMGGVIGILLSYRPGRAGRALATTALFTVLGAVFVRHGHERAESPVTAQGDLAPIREESGAAATALRAAADYLRDRPGAIVTLGERAGLVAATLGRAPVQQNVANEFAISVPRGGKLLDEWQTEFVRNLERRQVRYVVSDGNWEIRDAVRPTIAHILRSYRPVFEAPPYTIYERRER